MKSGTSTLNPNAVSYIPLSRREAPDVNKDCSLTTKDHKNNDKSVCLNEDIAHSQQDSESSKNYIAHGPLTLGDCSLKGSPAHSFHASSSQDPKDVAQQYIGSEDFDMDLAYLQMTFPDVSEDSIFGVYVACQGDLDATIDMLNQLEDYPSDSHMETQSTNNVSESGSSSGYSSEKPALGGGVGGLTSGSYHDQISASSSPNQISSPNN